MELTEVLNVILISATPISELRGGIPVAYFRYDFEWYWAVLVAVVGNMLPIPFLLLLFDPVVKLVSKVAWIKRLVEWFFRYTRRRGGLVEKYGWVGLTVFVGIPLPITGAWTGSVLAYLMGIEYKRALLAIFLGVLIAAVIVTTFCVLGWDAYLFLKR
ncbi:MAG: small multi-drug export protein [Dehalococcoidia bacterium]|nr:small multi-drug export protein [Dehalococcoidia bacterium]